MGAAALNLRTRGALPRSPYVWLLPFLALTDQLIEMFLIFPDYLKIDLDGAEQEIISGMTKTVKNKRLKIGAG